MSVFQQLELFAGTDDPHGLNATFTHDFKAITGFSPFKWQSRLYREFLSSDIPSALDLPTGIGKTSVLIIWLLARIHNSSLPRRLVYVVDRRAVVDQASADSRRIKDKIQQLPDISRRLGLDGYSGLPVSTLRGQLADNRDWLANPTSPAIIVGTIDMIGSRLLFEGYGVSRGMRPYHAGLLGADSLVVLDESHLCPPFQALLRDIVTNKTLAPSDDHAQAIVPRFHLLSLSATGCQADGTTFQFSGEDYQDEVIAQRLSARKAVEIKEIRADSNLETELVAEALELGKAGTRILVYCDQRRVAAKVAEEIRRRQKTAWVEVMTGARRVHERELLASKLMARGFLAGTVDPAPEASYLVSTSAGEVGIDLDADHLVMDLVSFERMIQRLGRVNRRGGKDATVIVLVADPGKQKDLSLRISQWRAPLEALPIDSKGMRDASPAAITALRQRAVEDPALGEILATAVPPEPLRPALSRALIDAWSMTSLDNHSGRPAVQPWLRGWVDEEEKQAKIAWRAYLPWRDQMDQPDPDEVTAYLEAAPIHLSETLEAPVFELVDLLIKRAGTVTQDGDAAGAESAGTSPSLNGHSPAVMFFNLSGQPKAIDLDGKSRQGLRVGELTTLTKDGKKALNQGLIGAQLLVQRALGGLNPDGLLDATAQAPPATVDQGWPRDDLRAVLGFRIRSEAEEAPCDEPGWRLLYRFQRAPEDEGGEPSLLIETYRGAKAPRQGDPAVARHMQTLDEHLSWAGQEADIIARALGLPEDYRRMFVLAAEVHDLGKARDLWQDAMKAPREWGADGNRRYYAKTRGGGDSRRLCGYRHEFGSLGDAEHQAGLMNLSDDLRDLALHLIASHHGYARAVVPPIDPLAPPSVVIQRAQEAALRFARLQRRWGPWGLSWWEAIFRAADQRASRKLDAQDKPEKE